MSSNLEVRNESPNWTYVVGDNRQLRLGAT